ncbi:MAG: WYL domain-containing protein [Polyangiaceae bacterium]|nr:WYL domain-containing protein [Polyangiaceae bacterium]
MGRRGATETAVAVLAAFIGKKRWEQAELARHVGVGARTLRSVLVDLETHGVPLTRKEHSGREVHWSVPPAWLPKGAVLTNNQASNVVRLLGRLPRSEGRDELLKVLTGPAAIALARSDREDAAAVLAALEDGLRDRCPVRLLYAPANGAEPRARVVSVQHLAYGQHVRFVGVEHAVGKLTWYRADRVLQIAPARTEPYRDIATDDVRDFVSGSADGYHKGGRLICRFVVTGEAARWVPGNLPVAGAKVEQRDGEVEIEVETAGLEVLARFVVGLGASARAVTPELAQRVTEIALGALGGGAEVRTGRNRTGSWGETGSVE